jgi:twitching motility protein PilT
MDITELLALGMEAQASDWHLSAGLPPMIRVHGDMRRTGYPALSHEQVRALVGGLLTPAQRQRYEALQDVDMAFDHGAWGRFRVNAFHQQHGAAAVLRRVPHQVPTLQALGGPAVLAELALRPRGLLLVTGPTGSGKSTTLAAMVGHLNAHAARHILTIEDPIEFVHRSAQCLINQREVGSSTLGFSAALRSALREDPDVILVGEMRDLETMRLAIQAAETGHLVLATLHTASAARSVERMVEVFPPQEKDMVRMMLAESLLAVVSQTLLKTADGQGRVAAYEVMVGTPAVRHLIRDNKVAQMYSVIQSGQALGMQTLDQSLAMLVRHNRVTASEARAHAQHPDHFLKPLHRS